ncbi:butyrophilin-like protein 2 [Chiloscyllium plagiosum]|uniref:butyrophilin-like protein 2 n=1 Tax=Chiloscyllium plagiosum TaxID=36176 RepID=UPI001CB8817E|nr:butyrophilin-like protein 2 [Chiloscyllium plagiosum]
MNKAQCQCSLCLSRDLVTELSQLLDRALRAEEVGAHLLLVSEKGTAVWNLNVFGFFQGATGDLCGISQSPTHKWISAICTRSQPTQKDSGISLSSPSEFRVSGPSHPVVAIVGEDAVLECYLVPQVFVNNMVVRWFKSDIRLPVHAYRNGQDDTAAQHQAYRKRTELFQGEVSQGKSILLWSLISPTPPLTVSQRCLNECLLIVVALGHEHWIQIDGYRKNGIQLMCESNGWFPQPQISWTGGNGQNLTAQSEINYRRDSNGLVNVQSSVAVTKDATNSFKCLIQNKLLKEEQEAAIQIAGRFMIKYSLIFKINTLFTNSIKTTYTAVRT